VPGSWQAKLVDSLESIALMSLLGVLAMLGTYAIAALTDGYADPLLAAADSLLGFDWVGLYHLTGANPWLSLIGRLAYLTIFFSPTIILLALHWTGRTADARRFLFAFAVSVAITLLVFAFFPARAALAHHLGADATYMPATGADYVRTIESLRAGTLTHVDLGSLQGLVAFPSFHAAGAFLFIWAAWPVKWLRGPMLVANVLMLAATPIEGGHYLVDLLGGALVAALSIGVVRRLSRRTAKEAQGGSAAERGGEPSGDLAVV
jgi:membrane-associated phospholipid phosphatase